MRESAEDAVVEINQIWRDEYLLVVGDDIGIEDDILNDIKIIACLAGLSNEDFNTLCKSLPHDPRNYKGHFIGTNALFTLLVLPYVDQLKKELKEEIQRPYRTLTVIYSGHGHPDGSWALYDDSFCASDLKEVLDSIPQLQHDFKMRIYLNCCYGLAFAEQVANSEVLFAAFRVSYEEDIKGSEKFPSGLKNLPVEEIIKYSTKRNPCSDNDTCMKVNECITDQMIRMWENARDFVKLDAPVEKFSGYILPFAFGPLDAKGVLQELTNKKNYQTSDRIKIDRAPPTKLESRLYEEGIDCRPADPQLIVFPAAHGDSTLFRWHNFNMLVDGGYLHSKTRCSMSPCFWETVRRLPDDQKLDIVVVTHYDEDHIAGILRLFEEEDGLPIYVGKLYTVIPLNQEPANTRSKSQGKRLVNLAKMAQHLENVLNLQTNCTVPIFNDYVSATDHLCIYMVTPTEENLHNARQAMSSRMSPPNIGSASLLIKCYIGSSKQYRYALLTGDAPPRAIIDGLNTLREKGILNGNIYQNNHYSFDYVDMPHHGAHKINPGRNDNNPELFLSNIHTKACLVSTDGKHYHHPQDESLDVFKRSLRDTNIGKLFFTYCKRKDEDIRQKLGEEQAKCVFANNDPINKQPTKCFLFDLSAHTYGECDTSNVTERHGRYDE